DCICCQPRSANQPKGAPTASPAPAPTRKPRRVMPPQPGCFVEPISASERCLWSALARHRFWVFGIAGHSKSESGAQPPHSKKYHRGSDGLGQIEKKDRGANVAFRSERALIPGRKGVLSRSEGRHYSCFVSSSLTSASMSW